MAWSEFFKYVLVMAGVTYLIRMLPLAAIRGKVKSRFVRGFLYYVPYAVLGAMTIPAVFSSTGSLPGAIAGVAVYRILMLDPTEPSRKVRGKTHTFRVPDSSRTDYSFFFTADLQFPAERHKTLLRGLPP